MAFKAQQVTGCEQITAVADRGYFNGDQVLSCEGTGVAPVVPKTLTSSGAKRGFFTRQDFIYDAEQDHYTCPAGCRIGSTGCPTPWACDDRLSSVRSGPSRPGWAPPTS